MGNNVIYFVDITKHTLQLYFTVPTEEILKERSYPELNRNSYILCHAMDFSLIFSSFFFFFQIFVFNTKENVLFSNLSSQVKRIQTTTFTKIQSGHLKSCFFFSTLLLCCQYRYVFFLLFFFYLIRINHR